MLGVNAAAEGSQQETAVVFRMQGQMRFKEEIQTLLWDRAERPRKDGDLQLTQQELPMKQQGHHSHAMRVELPRLE